MPYFFVGMVMGAMVEVGAARVLPEHKREGLSNGKMVGDLEAINQFVEEVIKAKRKGDNVIDFNHGGRKELVEEIRAINPDLIAGGVYSWDVDHLHLLMDNFQKHVDAIETESDPELTRLKKEFAELQQETVRVEVVERDEKTEDVRKFGYDIGALCVPLQQRRYDFGMQKIQGQLGSIEKWTEDQKQINLLLSAVLSAKQSGAQVIDLSADNLRPLVDQVRAINPALIPEGVYTWNADHLPILNERLQAHVATIESTISLRMLHINHDMQELTELIREFYDMLKQDREGKASMIRNARV